MLGDGRRPNQFWEQRDSERVVSDFRYLDVPNQAMSKFKYLKMEHLLMPNLCPGYRCSDIFCNDWTIYCSRSLQGFISLQAA